MKDLAITVVVNGKLEDVCQRVVETIKPAGFGVLTRIDFDKTIKQKIGESIQPCIILGACNPKLAFEAYQQSSDVALLIPCNIVLTEIAENKIRVEAMRPSQMLNILPAVQTSDLMAVAESKLKESLTSL